MTKHNIDELCINTIRFLSADAVQKANSGHPGMPMGDADMAYVLWTRFMKHNPKNPKWHNRDRFVLSAGHGSMLLYSLLYLSGYDISLNDIKNFRQLGSKTPGHPEYCLENGIELSTGPLGLGFGVGVGMALAEKYLAELFNRPGFNIVDYNIYGIVSDGDIMEGISSEAASFAGHFKLGKIIYLYSDNKTTIDGSTDLTFSDDVGKKFEAHNWHVINVDGYDLEGIENAIKRAKQDKTRPSLIIARTHLGYGSPNKQDVPDIHGAPLGEEELKLTKENLGWPPQKKFYVPKEVLKHYRQALNNGKKEETSWNQMFKKYRDKHPDLAEMWDTFSNGELKKGWQEKLPRFRVESGNIATRSASGNVLNAIAEDLQQLIGGSADLAPSNLTGLKRYDRFGLPGGRNIHFGIREHAMGAILSGISLSRMLVPYGGTYLVFSEFMYPMVRMASLMKNRIIYILTHDSIGVGEDGPSHHPIAHLTVLRATPNLLVLRPADANETAVAWETALEYKDGPVALILTRQSVPIIDRNEYASERGLKKGAYIIADSKGEPDLIIIATGSEVHLSLKAHKTLTKKGHNVRVVNMPSVELFELQTDEYKKSILPPTVKRRLSIEAGSTLTWYKYVGLEGRAIGIDRFTESAPGKVLFEHYGFTEENVVKTAEELLKK